MKQYYKIAYWGVGGGNPAAILPGLYLSTIQSLEDGFHGEHAVYRDEIKCTTVCIIFYGTAKKLCRSSSVCTVLYIDY